MKIKFTLVFSFVIFFFNNLYAQVQQGCRLSNGRVYAFAVVGYSCGVYSLDNCPTGSTTFDQYANITHTYTTNCTTCFGLGSSGKVVDYNLLNCPIDDPYLIALLSVMFLFPLYISVRKRLNVEHFITL